MGKIDDLERRVKELSAEELAAFRGWFIAFDWEVWDRKLERDIAAGKLDSLADKALREHSEGKSTRL